MEHRAIIAKAWQVSQTQKSKLFIFGFFLAIITLTVETAWMAWQYFSFSNAPALTGNEFYLRTFVESVVNFFIKSGEFTVWFVIGAILFAFLWFIVTPICQGGLIVLLKRAHDGLEIKKRQGLSEGILNFFKLFAFHNLLSFVFNVFSIFTYTTIPLKFIGWDAFYLFLIPGILWLIVALVGNILFIYVRFFLVLRGMHLGESIAASARFVVRYFTETFIVFILLFIISLRVLLNIILVFLVPAFITSVLGYFIQAVIGYQVMIMTTLAIIMLFVAAWIYGNFFVFTQAVWEYTFLELEKKDRTFEAEQAAK